MDRKYKSPNAPVPIKQITRVYVFIRFGINVITAAIMEVITPLVVNEARKFDFVLVFLPNKKVMLKAKKTINKIYGVKIGSDWAT